MSDIIKLLPDSIANQIAAGEVIQRPASVVKELMENAIDAGSTEIKLILKDAGKVLIQLIDNGKGMSETDARMCFERHATSKIRSADDLFKITSMGFRGEAMASIASIAHVEMQTKTKARELGTRLVIKGSKVETQEPCSTPEGTNIQVRNLFYNVPARRKFLKADPTELKHIIDEFTRVALAHSDIHFSLHHNENELFHLPPTNLRQRIVGLLGKSSNKSLVPVEEVSDWIVIDGFVGKPESVRKTKGEQFIFVNNRFIRSNYLNHAIRSAYDELIAKEAYPLYVLFIKIDPAKIDVNVHPTKQEIKFEDERLIYNYIKVSVRHAVARYTLTPVIDFDEESNFERRMMADPGDRQASHTTSNSSSFGGVRITDPREKANAAQWQSIYEGMQNGSNEEQAVTVESRISQEVGIEESASSKKKISQLQKSFIISQISSGLMIIDQQAAHERILYDKYLTQPDDKEHTGELTLFSETIELSSSQTQLLEPILDQLNSMGFDISNLGTNTYVVRSVPHGFIKDSSLTEEIGLMLQNITELQDVQNQIQQNIAQTVASKACIKRGKKLEEEEMIDLIDQLFACEIPYLSPSGKKCFITIELDEIKKRFTEV